MFALTCCLFAELAGGTRLRAADEPKPLPDHPTFGHIERLIRGSTS